MKQLFLSPLLVLYLGIMIEILEAFYGTPEQNEKSEILIFFFSSLCKLFAFCHYTN